MSNFSVNAILIKPELLMLSMNGFGGFFTDVTGLKGGR